MTRYLIFLLLSVFPVSAYADYLEIRTSTNVWTEPNSSSRVLISVARGENIALEDVEQDNAHFYKVVILDASKGWIPRTHVRRRIGQIPLRTSENYPVYFDLFGEGAIPVEYYDGTEGLKGNQLKQELHKIIKDHKRLTYSQVWEALVRTDKHPYFPNQIVLLYTLRLQDNHKRDRGTSFQYPNSGYTLIDSWNREHIWPKSHGFPAESDTAYTDLHHLRPTDRSVNSARNTRSFDYSPEVYFDNGGTVETFSRTSGVYWTWEPPDEVKGDVARMLFYMAVRYEGPKYDLEIVDEVVKQGNKSGTIGVLSTLLKWHKEDPVDNWERQRNHIIYKEFQGNRNPFIDHPDFVEKIWKID